MGHGLGGGEGLLVARPVEVDVYLGLRVSARQAPGHDQGQGRLADAAHAPHAGDGGACLHLGGQLLQLGVPADEVGRRRRELVEG